MNSEIDRKIAVILVADVVKVTVDALSLSVIVIVTDCVPLSKASPPETVSIAITAVSFEAASYKLSSVGVNVVVPVVAPADTVIFDKLP